mmetsp:Transcript_146049/g.468375  ORF Transcript_146049/g.468375 Transcript_146049/m.468375 type:complete len:253 (-) Transcript_146049:828-1586(-)
MSKRHPSPPVLVLRPVPPWALLPQRWKAWILGARNRNRLGASQRLSSTPPTTGTVETGIGTLPPTGVSSGSHVASRRRTSRLLACPPAGAFQAMRTRAHLRPGCIRCTSTECLSKATVRSSRPSAWRPMRSSWRRTRGSWRRRQSRRVSGRTLLNRGMVGGTTSIIIIITSTDSLRRTAPTTPSIPGAAITKTGRRRGIRMPSPKALGVSARCRRGRRRRTRSGGSKPWARTSPSSGTTTPAAFSSCAVWAR